MNSQIPPSFIPCLKTLKTNVLDFLNGGKANNCGDWKRSVSCYRADSRPVSRRWQEIVSFAAEHSDKLTDESLSRAAEYAFSGRLEIRENEIFYCAGQYFPTEYRNAVLAVLKAAAN